MKIKNLLAWNVAVAGVFAAAVIYAASVPPPVSGQGETVVPPTQPVVQTTPKVDKPRTSYDQETLKKMAETLCAAGFKAYVGDEGKNICKGWATAPDIAYTCVWDKDGPPSYESSPKGPCNLDYTAHRGDIIITRDQYKDNPPLKYGSQVQCCYRSAAGPQ